MIALVGMDCRFPGGSSSPEAYWDFLCSGADGVVPVPYDRWDSDVYYDPDVDQPHKTYAYEAGFISGVEYFDNAFFGISESEAGQMDPQQRVMLAQPCIVGPQHATDLQT